MPVGELLRLETERLGYLRGPERPRQVLLVGENQQGCSGQFLRARVRVERCVTSIYGSALETSTLGSVVLDAPTSAWQGYGRFFVRACLVQRACIWSQILLYTTRWLDGR